MTKSMGTPARRTSHSKIMGMNMKFVPPFVATSVSTLLGRLSDVGTLLLGLASIQPQALVRFDTDVGQLGRARTQRSISSQ